MLLPPVAFHQGPQDGVGFFRPGDGMHPENGCCFVGGIDDQVADPQQAVNPTLCDHQKQT